MGSRFRWSQARAAALAALGITLVAIAAIVLDSGPGTYRVSAVFSQVNGLVTGARVEVAGLRVGTVDAIELGDDGLPHVAMEVASDYPLRRGATAQVQIASASGEASGFVELTAGKGPELPSGSTLRGAPEMQPVSVSDVLSILNARTRQDVRSALAELHAVLAGEGGDIHSLLRDAPGALAQTSSLLREVNSDGAALRELVAHGGEVAAELARDRDTLGGTADRLTGVLAVTARRSRELARIAELLPAGLAAPTAALENLDSSIPALSRLVSDARPGVAELAPFAKALPPALRQARPALGDAGSLMASAPATLGRLEPLVRRAIPTLRSMRPALRSLGPILNEARVRTPDFFSFFSNWADFTSVYDANGHAARVGLVLPPAPDNSIDGSDPGAGSLTAPFVRTPGVLEGDPWTHFRDSFLGKGNR